MPSFFALHIKGTISGRCSQRSNSIISEKIFADLTYFFYWIDMQYQVQKVAMYTSIGVLQ